MGSMSWTDDTRCLYCEGRLPLYRKITHGQFCSSAHRKAYWQEQERLAVERLHQTHHSLRAYRSQAQADAPEPEPVPMVVAAPPELQPIPLLEAPEAIPAVLSLLAPELLPSSGSSPALIAPNPVVYEIPWQPLPPSSVVKVPETSAFPEGHPVAGWARLAPQPWTSQSVLGESGGVEESAVALSHPQSANPAVRIQAGGIVELPLTLGRKAPGTVAPIGSSLQALTIELPPVIDVAFEVQPQSDVLIQLLDQQIPRPDRLHALSQFAAHQSELPIAGSLQEQFDAPASTILPVAALSPVVPDHHLSVAAMLALPARVEPSLGNIVSQAAISEIPVIPQGIGISVVATPAVEQSAYQVGTAGLESLPSRLLKPAQGVFAQATDLTALDLSTGVSSDIVFPSFVPGPKATAVPLPTGILPLTFSKRKVDAP
ncbi:MAG: hypothetical protein JWO19_1335, partial [Bryobacterales bacterium]|nr:hypothetical protein [Bryobacterales bacterium]